MLRSSNPILSKEDAFTPAAPNQNQYSQYNPYGQPSNVQDPYNPYQAQPGTQPYGAGQPPQAPAAGRMTFDDVITKTAVVMGILVISAALSWMFIPTPAMYPALIISALLGFGAVLLVSFRRNISPPLVFAYAAIEGVFIGMISKLFEILYPGIVAQAVLGTFVAAGVTLAAYKLFNIRVTPKFQKVVVLSTIAFAALMLVNFLFAIFTGTAGLRGGITGPVSLLAVGISAIAIILCVLNLILDFDYIEKGVQMGAPASESWRGAFGLTVTMVWLYIEILRILSYLRR